MHTHMHTRCTHAHTMNTCTHGAYMHTRCTYAHTVHTCIHDAHMHTRCTHAYTMHTCIHGAHMHTRCTHAYTMHTCTHDAHMHIQVTWRRCSPHAHTHAHTGDLATMLSAVGCLPEAQVNFYFAEVLLGLKYLHDEGVVCLSPQPSNRSPPRRCPHSAHTLPTCMLIPDASLINLAVLPRTACRMAHHRRHPNTPALITPALIIPNHPSSALITPALIIPNHPSSSLITPALISPNHPSSALIIPAPIIPAQPSTPRYTTT